MPGVPGFPPGASWARPSHKKPPAGAGGLRVACLPPCHAKQVRTAEMRPVGQHGWRDGFHARSPRVSTRGFLSRAASTKSPRREPGDSGSRAFPRAMRNRFEPRECVQSDSMDGGMVFMPGVPGFHPGLLGRDRPTKSPRREPGDSGSHACPPAMRNGFEPRECVQSDSMDGGEVFMPGVPGFPPGASCRAPHPQKAPGGSRGTPGRMPSPVPCEADSNRGNASSRTAWMAGWLSCPESPGFHPGLLGP